MTGHRAAGCVATCLIVSAMLLTSGAASANPYETLKIRVLSPTNMKTTAGSILRVLNVSDATKPVVFRFAVVNTGSAPLSNVEVRFLPKAGILSTTPHARIVSITYGYAQWKIKSLPGHQRRLYAVTVKFVNLSADGGWRGGISAWGHLKGVNGTATDQVEMAAQLSPTKP